MQLNQYVQDSVGDNSSACDLVKGVHQHEILVCAPMHVEVVCWDR